MRILSCLRSCNLQLQSQLGTNPPHSLPSSCRCKPLCPSICCCAGPSHRCSGKLWKCLLVFVCVTFLLANLHYSVLPRVNGSYNENCTLSLKSRQRMRYLLRHVVNFFNAENVTYWLDFGTLLGAVREGDIIAHDGDMDVSRMADDLKADGAMIKRLSLNMSTLGIKADEFKARFKGVQVDLFRWVTVNASSGEPRVKKYYPFEPKFQLAEALSDYLLPTEVPKRVLFPLKAMSVSGILAKVPRRTLEALKIKYPLTWHMAFPYKWKCWWDWNASNVE